MQTLERLSRSLSIFRSLARLQVYSLVVFLYAHPINEAEIMRCGNHNTLTDVPGIEVGHHTDRGAMSGVTVILCREGATAGVDVRGGAPGTRETDLLAPQNLVDKVQAVVFSGGSVYGLAAADGVVGWLGERGIGFPLEKGAVAPIVPAAVIYDLGRGKETIPPICADWGRRACEDANSGPLASGSIGAGTGALSGGIKGGTGTASIVLDSGITVAALAVVNSLGSVIDPESGRPWEIGLELADEFGLQGRRTVGLPPVPAASLFKNTTLGVIATDVYGDKAQATKIAQMAHDGIARAVRPAHTMYDGDILFCLVTGKGRKKLDSGPESAPMLTALGSAAADCLARAIIKAVLSAQSLGGITAFADLKDRGTPLSK